MSDLSMWFGTRGYMQWVPCPLVDSDMSKVGWNSSAQYLNGGTRIRSSVAAHKEYNLAWGLQERDNIRTITDYADGVYGDDLIYFVDPFAADKNVLPQYWATPALAAEDAPILTGTAKPSLVETDSNTNGYPRYSAVYYVLPTDPKKNIYVPIPPGYTAWVGFHGQKPDDSTAYVRVRQAIGATGYGTSTALIPLSNDTTVQVNANFNSSTTVHGIVLDLQGTGTLIMTSLIVQLRKTSSEYGTTFTNLVTNPSMEASSGTVTVRTNLVTNPSMETVSTGTVVMRRNLCTNPSFEVDATGWSGNFGTGGAGTAARVAGGYIGGYEYRMTWTTASTGGFSNASGANIAATVGTAYTYSVWVKTSVARQVQATVNWLTSASAYISTSYGTLTSVPANTWTRLSVTATAPANTGFVQPNTVSATNYAIGDTFAVDGALVEASSVMGDYFDGSTTDALGWDYAWSGTANASISTAACAATTVRTNLSVDPAATANIGAGSTLRWAPQWYGSGGAGTTSVITGQTGPVGGLTTAMRKTWTTVGSAAQDISYNFSGSGTSAYPVTAGTTYAVSMYYRTSWSNIGSTLSNNGIYFTWYNSAGTTLTSTSGTSVPHAGANVWTRVSSVQTAPANAAYVTISHQFYTSILPSIGSTFDGTGLLVETSSVVGDYFDGSFNPAGDFSYAWTGTANASTSIARGAAVATVVAGWAGSEYADIQTNTDFKYGSKSWKSICKLPQTFLRGVQVPLTSGTTYAFSAWVKPSVTRTFRIVIQGSAGIADSSFISCPAGVWTQISRTGTPTATGSFNVYVNSETGAATGDVYLIDGFMVEASPIVQDYFDGSVVSADADLTNSWSGTAHASTSLMRGVGVANVWSAGAATVQSTKWASTGTKSIRITPTTSDTNSWASFSVATTVGATYTAKVKIRLAAPQTGTLQPNARKIRVFESTTSTVLGESQASNTAGVQELTVTFTATTATSLVYLWNGASAGNGDVWFDDLLVVRGTYTDEYFDGSTAGYGNVTYGWTNSALPNASTSYQYVTPTTGGYISGQGHSGCKFAEQPKLQNYSSAMDKSALTAKLVEVGAWA